MKMAGSKEPLNQACESPEVLIPMQSWYLNLKKSKTTSMSSDVVVESEEIRVCPELIGGK